MLISISLFMYAFSSSPIFRKALRLIELRSLFPISLTNSFIRSMYPRASLAVVGLLLRYWLTVKLMVLCTSSTLASCFLMLLRYVRALSKALMTSCYFAFALSVTSNALMLSLISFRALPQRMVLFFLT